MKTLHRKVLRVLWQVYNDSLLKLVDYLENTNKFFKVLQNNTGKLL